MHVYIGGAHNGKTDYVKRLFGDDALFFCTMETVEQVPAGKRPVITDVHDWLGRCGLDEQAAKEAVLRISTPDTVFLLTDIGRGVVPADKAQRELRDRCGRLYQQLFAMAADVTRIWYGIPQTIKRSDSQ